LTANATLTDSDQVVLCAPAANTLLTLPSAANNAGQEITIKRTTTGATPTCGVAGIWATDSTGTFALTPPASGGASSNVITVFSDGTNWYLINMH
jgi:hypothetical protein